MTTQITPEQSSNAIRMLRECGDHHSAAIIDSLADQVEALKVERDAALAASSYETDLCGQALADLKIITEERDSLKTDAARYRWLRDSEWEMFDDAWLGGLGIFGEGPDELDAALDAAMAVQS